MGAADKTHAVDAVSIVDLSEPDPEYRAPAPRTLPRMRLNAVLLPDSWVIAAGLT